jgi:hypothetical protein
MPTINYGLGAPAITGITQDQDYSLTLVPATTISSVTGTGSTQRDSNIVLVSGANVDTVFNVQFVDAPGDGTTVTNLTPGVATFSGSAVAQLQAGGIPSGVAMVQASHPTLGTRIVQQAVQRALTGSSKAWSSYITGSLAADLSSMIDTAISGVTASLSTTAIYSSLATNTRNASLWCGSLVDLTAISQPNYPSIFTGMTLIGPHHILTAAHVVNFAPGGLLGFVGSDGSTYVGVVVNETTLAGLNTYSPGQQYYTDLAICYVADSLAGYYGGTAAGAIAAYNALNPSYYPATKSLSQAFTGGNKIKPMALLPAAAWAQAAVTSQTSAACPLPIDPMILQLPAVKPVPAFHYTRSANIGIWDIVDPPFPVRVNGFPLAPFENEFAIAQSAVATRAPFSAYANVTGSASGDVTFTAIPAGSTLATNNPTLGAGYPILLGTNHDNYVGFGAPWTPLYVSAITTAMQSTAQAAGDAAYASYAPIVVSLTGYSSY